MMEDIPPEDALHTFRACDVETRAVEWLWEPWIPRGKLTVLDGLPGLAKSTITLDLAARVTDGRPMPDAVKAGVDGPVVMASYEDDPADTIVPRFMAAGGDTKRLHLFDSVRTREGLIPVELPNHVDMVEALVVETGAVLVVIDPLMAALAGDVKSAVDHHVRRALAPLRSMAERTRAAVLLVRHLNKSSKVSDPILRGGGSIGIIGAARAGLLVAHDPDDSGRRVLAISKANLAPAGYPSLGYRVVTDDAHGVGAIEWLGKSRHEARDLLRDSDEPRRDAVSDAVAILHEFLAEGPVPSTEAKAYCREAGIAPRTLDRAKKQLGVRARPRLGGEQKRWVWELPVAQH